MRLRPYSEKARRKGCNSSGKSESLSKKKGKRKGAFTYGCKRGKDKKGKAQCRSEEEGGGKELGSVPASLGEHVFRNFLMGGELEGDRQLLKGDKILGGVQDDCLYIYCGGDTLQKGGHRFLSGVRGRGEKSARS